MKFKSNKLNLNLTLLGGQSFLWKKLDNGFIALHSDFAVRIWQDKKLYYAEQIFGDEINLKAYFDEGALQDFFKTDIVKDEPIFQKMREDLGDLLVIRQPLVDTFFSFLLSSNNSILRIRRSVECLSKNFGQSIQLKSERLFLFPSAETLSMLKEKDFVACGAGYRAKFLKESVQKFLREKDELENTKGVELIEKLKEFKGVGDKVADCIAVFSGRADEYSPIDRWAKRAILNTYEKEFAKYDEYRKFLSKKFGKHAKFAGQYLFETERLKS